MGGGGGGTWGSWYFFHKMTDFSVMGMGKNVLDIHNGMKMQQHFQRSVAALPSQIINSVYNTS